MINSTTNKRNLKIGVLMDSLSMNSSLAELITDLEKNQKIDIILLQNKFTSEGGLKRSKTKVSNEGIIRFLSIAFFNITEKIEHAITKKFDSKYALDSKNVKLNDNLFSSISYLNPIFYRKFFVKYSESDIERIRNLELDFILRGNGSGIFKGDILKVSKYGLISLHHGDNTWNRGGPPGFWEVYLEKRKSGFIIQICSEKLDDGNVIFRGETATKSTYLKNRINLSQISYLYIEKIFMHVYASGKLPFIKKLDTSNSQLFKLPKLSISVHYIMKILFFYISKAFRRLILRQKQVWNIAYQKNNWQLLDLKNLTILKNPKGRFLADPFIFKEKSTTATFVEDYSLKDKKGVISSILFDEKNNPITKNIIEEDFHLSFPFVFKYNDKIYMVPESRQDKSIRLYECIDFPNKWKFVYKIMDNVNAVDSIIFYKKPYWWLLTNICDDKSSDFTSRLHAFYADSPLSKKWNSHSRNPIIFSSDYSRNGGIILEDGKIFRVRQKYGFNQYGKEISVAEIINLDEHNFHEELNKSIKPGFMSGVNGIHHLSTDKNHSVIDFVKEKVTLL